MGIGEPDSSDSCSACDISAANLRRTVVGAVLLTSPRRTAPRSQHAVRRPTPVCQFFLVLRHRPAGPESAVDSVQTHYGPWRSKAVSRPPMRLPPVLRGELSAGRVRPIRLRQEATCPDGLPPHRAFMPYQTILDAQRASSRPPRLHFGGRLAFALARWALCHPRRRVDTLLVTVQTGGK